MESLYKYRNMTHSEYNRSDKINGEAYPKFYPRIGFYKAVLWTNDHEYIVEEYDAYADSGVKATEKEITLFNKYEKLSKL